MTDTVEAVARAHAGDIARDVCELPDRTSPDGEPDMLLVTWQELEIIAERHIASAIAAHEAALRDAGMVIVPREPPPTLTDAMQDAVELEVNGVHGGDATIEEVAPFIWRWMIAAALGETP